MVNIMAYLVLAIFFNQTYVRNNLLIDVMLSLGLVFYLLKNNEKKSTLKS